MVFEGPSVHTDAQFSNPTSVAYSRCFIVPFQSSFIQPEPILEAVMVCRSLQSIDGDRISN